MLLGVDECNTPLTLKTYLLVTKTQILIFDKIICRGRRLSLQETRLEELSQRRSVDWIILISTGLNHNDRVPLKKQEQYGI